MVRKNYMITPRQAEKLQERAKEEETSVSELLRKIIDAYFKGVGK